MPNKKNVASVEELEERFRESPVVLLTEYRGLKVSDLANLRRQLREAGVDYRIAKNTLLAIAAREAGRPGMEAMLEGPTAVAFSTGDEIQAARTLADFARTSRILTLKGGLLGQQVISSEDLTQLAALPGRSQVQADLVGAVQAPLASVYSVLNSALASIVYALEEREKQLQPA